MTNIRHLMLVAVSLLFACTNNDPISARRDLLSERDSGTVLMKSFVPRADQEQVITTTINAGRSTLLLAGDHAGVRTQMLLRFAPSPGTVREVTLKLPIHLVMGTGMAYEPSIHRVTASWSEDSVTAAKLPPQFYDPAPIGTAEFAALDSLRDRMDADTLLFHLDPAVVNGWGSDTINVVITSSSPEMLFEFHSRESIYALPRMQFLVTRTSAEDTTYLATPLADVHIFSRQAPLPDGPLYVGNGEKRQSYLRFNVADSIPANATISRAELVLTLDTLNTLNNADMFPLAPYLISAITSTDPLQVTLGASAAQTATFVNTTDATIKLGLTYVVLDWVQRPEHNLGLVLEPLFPQRDLLRIAFHSTATSPTQAPTLVVYYTVPPPAP